MKKTLLLIPLTLILAACDPLLALPPTGSQAPIPSATRTVVITSTLTPYPTPTITPSPSPTLDPLSTSRIMQDVLLHEDDLLEFFEAIDVPTDGFADGSQMDFTRGLPEFTHWDEPVPDTVRYRYRTALQTNRIWPERDPLRIALHSNAIFVFPDEESAHAYYLADIAGIDPEFIIDMETIGDESVAFSGYLEYNRPAGGVIWRHDQVYIFLLAQLNFPVTDKALAGIAGRVQARLEWIIQRGSGLDAPTL